MTSAKLDVNQFKHMFSNLIDFLLTTPRDKLPSQSTRNNIVDSLTEYYFKEQGEYPEPYLLEQLANYCLLDYIKSVNKKKSDKNRGESLYKLFLRFKVYLQGKKFMDLLEDFRDTILVNGNELTQKELIFLTDNIRKDYESRVSAADFFLNLMNDYFEVYLVNPSMYKGNKTMEIRICLLESIYILMLKSMDKLDMLDIGGEA